MSNRKKTFQQLLTVDIDSDVLNIKDTTAFANKSKVVDECLPFTIIFDNFSYDVS